MKKVVVIDDDPKLRSLMRVRLQSTYELFDTGDPAEAFGLVLANKPMPSCSICSCRDIRVLNFA